jgi:transposase InsO family protein
LSATTFALTWNVFDRLFREHGLPDAILSDNGTPFSSNSVKRLSKLSVRWIRLGIEPRLIQPGKPQQNGRHERMHRTMKAEACAHPAADCRRQSLLKTSTMAVRSFTLALWNSVTTPSESTSFTSTDPGLSSRQLPPTNNPTSSSLISRSREDRPAVCHDF